MFSRIFRWSLLVYTATVTARITTPGGMRWVPIATLKDEALPNLMRKVIAHGLGEDKEFSVAAINRSKQNKDPPA